MKSAFEKAPIWLSVLCSVITISVVVWRGGALASTVEHYETRIANIETHGSIAAQKHFEKDDERVADMERRLEKMERIAENIALIQADIREIKTELKNLKTQ